MTDKQLLNHCKHVLENIKRITETPAEILQSGQLAFAYVNINVAVNAALKLFEERHQIGSD